MNELRRFSLKTFTNRGYNLTPVELKDVVPFEVKRLYYIDGTTDAGSVVGGHCHKTEVEVFIQVKGSSTAAIDRGDGMEEFLLQGPGDAFYCPTYVWHEFRNPSPDCVLLALSSTNYSPDRSDYIEDYDAFVAACRERRAASSQPAKEHR